MTKKKDNELADANKVRKEYITRITVEMDPSTKEWLHIIMKKYGCETYREIFFIALKFLDETPLENMPFDMLGVLQNKGIQELPQDMMAIRWMNIKKLQGEINNYNIRTNKDKEILVKMQSEMRKLINDHGKDKASEMVEELKEIRKELLEQMDDKNAK